MSYFALRQLPTTTDGNFRILGKMNCPSRLPDLSDCLTAFQCLSTREMLWIVSRMGPASSLSLLLGGTLYGTTSKDLCLSRRILCIIVDTWSTSKQTMKYFQDGNEPFIHRTQTSVAGPCSPYTGSFSNQPNFSIPLILLSSPFFP